MAVCFNKRHMTLLGLALCVMHTLALLSVEAGFFMCPSSCQAMLLPRDMESIDDCLCPEGAVVPTTAFQCPEGSAATRPRPQSFADCACSDGLNRDETRKICTTDEFECTGRYQLKKGVSTPKTMADCDCQHPYKKDDATGTCQLRKCPRAGNYVKRESVLRVTSLADCRCVDPFVKNEQSGECLAAALFMCPPNSEPAPNRAPRSFADCHCDWGFVRTKNDDCERENVAFACPKNSIKRTDLPLGERPRSFADCECENSKTAKFVRNDVTHSCDKIKTAKTNTKGDDDEDEEDGSFQCPQFSRPLAPLPHSIEQCECLPSYGWKTPEMTCVRLSGYRCPPHSYKFDDATHIESSFADCACARGYYRDEVNGACLEWFLANDNGCPAYAYLKHWPLQSKANCQCVYGAVTPPPSTAAPEEEEEADDQKENAKKLRQRKFKRGQREQELVKKKPQAKCLAPPLFDGLSFSQCPPNSFAIDWPVMTPDDCVCFDGYVMADMSDAELTKGDGEGGIRCVRKVEEDEDANTDEDDEEADAIVIEATVDCKAPLVRNPYNGECRLPVEEVKPALARNKKTGAITFSATGPVMFQGIEYDYVLTEENIMVIQGDIAIGELVQWPSTTKQTSQQAAAHVLHGYFNADRDHRWKDATMCFEVDPTARAFEGLIKEAMVHITSVTNFEFRQCDANLCLLDRECSHDYVSVTKTTSSCFSYIGRIGGPQLLGVSSECGLGNLMHVILHAIGLHHTIDRPDRDEHVKIAWECVPESKRSYFIVEDERDGVANDTAIAEDMDTPYDYYSIMHHPANAFVQSTNNAPGAKVGDRAGPATTTTSSPGWCQSVFPMITDPEERIQVMSRMGQRERMAVTDIHAVWRLYPSLQTHEAPTYNSERKDGPPQSDDVHESRLHTEEDVRGDKSDFAQTKKGKSFGQKLGSFIGALVTLVGFGAFMAFAVVEFKKRSLRGTDAYYSESLLADKALYD